MKKIALTLIVIQLISFNLKAQKFNNTVDSVSYSLGVLVAQNLKSQGFTDLNYATFTQAIETVMKGEKPLLTPSQCQQSVQAYATQHQSKAAEANRMEGQQFLAKNKLRPEVTTLPDGLQYEILKSAEGPKPKSTDKVLVHYHGTLIDGTVFDSSVDRGEPIAFSLMQVIKGWTEVLQLMPVGSKWRVYLPYDLAYGEHGSGPKIGPYATLIFEIELLEIQ
jgi:FKBP-type peptidyl-prolyl cis-trans isomerase FklB